MQRGRSYLVAVAGVALALAACGGAQSDDDAQGTSELGETITDFIPGAMAFDPEGGEDQFRQQEQQVQEMIRECMAEQGFEYVPYVPNFDDEFYGGAESEEESVERYGLYISYDLLQQEQYSEEEIPPELADDPNFAIQEALSPEEQEAYYAALWGPEPDIDYESMTEDEINAFFETWEPEGCETAAYEDVFGGGGADQAFYEEFGEAMEDNYQSVESDPRIVELEEAWSKCMAEEGYEFRSQRELEAFILRRLEEVGAIFDLEFDSEGYVMGFGADALEPGSDTYRAIEMIFEEEVAIAKASLACDQGTEDVWIEVYEEYEQRFIDENRAALEKFRDENS